MTGGTLEARYQCVQETLPLLRRGGIRGRHRYWRRRVIAECVLIISPWMGWGLRILVSSANEDNEYAGNDDVMTACT